MDTKRETLLYVESYKQWVGAYLQVMCGNFNVVEVMLWGSPDWKPYHSMIYLVKTCSQSNDRRAYSLTNDQNVDLEGSYIVNVVFYDRH
jgi:hypothetical protein